MLEGLNRNGIDAWKGLKLILLVLDIMIGSSFLDGLIYEERVSDVLFPKYEDLNSKYNR